MNKTFSRSFKSSFLQQILYSVERYLVLHTWLYNTSGCSGVLKQESIINLCSLDNISSPWVFVDAKHNYNSAYILFLDYKDASYWRSCPSLAYFIVCLLEWRMKWL